MKKLLKKRKKLLRNFKLYGIITVGAFLGALGISLFLAPADIVAGGVSGIGIILHGLFRFPIGTFMFIINIPIFIIGTKSMGRGFLIKSLYGALMLSVFTDVVSYIPPVTEDLLLSCLMGGALLGIGMGIIFLTGATTGGVDILAKLLNKLIPSLDVGKCLFAIDAVIIAAGGLAFADYELCLYGVIALFLNTYLIDTIIQGANAAKIVYIISPHHEEIASSIINHMSRGISGIQITGMYKNTQRLMLMCVMKNHELPKLRRIIAEYDKNAFIIFIRAREVSGEGFKIYPIN